MLKKLDMDELNTMDCLPH